MCFFVKGPSVSSFRRYRSRTSSNCRRMSSARANASLSPRQSARPSPSWPRRAHPSTYALSSSAYTPSVGDQSFSLTSASTASGSARCFSRCVAREDVPCNGFLEQGRIQAGEPAEVLHVPNRARHRDPREVPVPLVEGEGEEPRRRGAGNLPRAVNAEHARIHVDDGRRVAKGRMVVENDRRAPNLLNYIELAGAHVAHDHELVCLFVDPLHDVLVDN